MKGFDVSDIVPKRMEKEHRVLLVLKDGDGLKTIREHLNRDEMLKCGIRTTTDPNTAMERMSEDVYDLVIVEYDGSDGRMADILKAVKRRYPRTVRLLAVEEEDIGAAKEAFKKNEIHAYVPSDQETGGLGAEWTRDVIAGVLSRKYERDRMEGRWAEKQRGREIHERAKAQAIIWAQKEFTDTIVGAIPCGLIVVDPELTVKFVNHAWRVSDPGETILTRLLEDMEKKIVEFSKDFGKYDVYGRRYEDRYFNIRLTKIRMAFETEEAPRTKVPSRYLPPYEDEYPLGLKYAPDEGLLLMLIIDDITDRKRLEDELKRHSESLEIEVRKKTNELIRSEKMASLGQLVAGVAHEVNNPLAYIKSNSQIIGEELLSLKGELERNGLESEALHHLQDFNRTNMEGINRISTITRTLKRFATPNAGRERAVNVNKGIKDTLLIVHNRLKHRIKVHEDYGDIPKIKCNLSQLNQVFMNMIMNAVQAMDRGEIWIKTRNDEQNIYIRIEDNGKGIPADRLNKIFDPFFSTKDRGTGLGLSICYRIVKDHGGDIEVDSQEGKGTRMVIGLPYDKE